VEWQGEGMHLDEVGVRVPAQYVTNKQ
jgi:hypothetical protein